MIETYSQCGEDACIYSYFERRNWRKYKSNKIIDRGFFVDVGCYHPVVYSNTYCLYKMGWRGVNIDGALGVKERFDKVRPHDSNIWALVSDSSESLTFYTWGESVYNTASKDIAEKLYREGRVDRPAVPITPPILKFSQIFSDYMTGDAIDLLTVDAEGHDLEVLRSNDWARYRPELVVAEDHHHNVEGMLLCNISKYLKSVGYRVYAWVPPSIIFVNE